MKKAYVKPVFLAEEFVAETSYANSACGISSGKAFTLYIDDNNPQHLCTHSPCKGHDMTSSSVVYTGENSFIVDSEKNTDTMTYWNYATKSDNEATLFSFGAVDCDFMWKTNGQDQVSAWKYVDNDTRASLIKSTNNIFDLIITGLGSFSQFFHGNHGNGSSGNGQHEPGEAEGAFFSL